MDGFSLSLIIAQDGALLEIHEDCFIQGFHHGVMMDDAKSVHLQDTTILHSTDHNIFVCGDGNNELYMDNAKILMTAKDTNGLCLPNFHLVQASSSHNNIKHIDLSLRDVKAKVVCIWPIVKRFLLVLQNIPIGGWLDNAHKARLLGVGSWSVLSGRLSSTQYKSK
jgi:hypothetical protein